MEFLQSAKGNSCTIQNEVQSISAIQHLISTMFSCIGYLRDLFDEEYFEDHEVAEIPLKRFKRGYSVESDCLLDWIEKGCSDALKTRHLRTVVFGIYLDKNKPNEMVETYALNVTYPLSSICNTHYKSAGFPVKANNDTMYSCSNKENDFKETLGKILRYICVFAQTLKTLPDEKYLAMKLYYYDNITLPDDKQYCFQSRSSEENDFYFKLVSFKYEAGNAYTPYHSVNIIIQTVSDNFDTDRFGSNMHRHLSQAQSQTFEGYHTIQEPQSATIFSQVWSKSSNATDCILSYMSPYGKKHKNRDCEIQNINPNKTLQPLDTDAKDTQTIEVTPNLDIVRCLCGYNGNDLAMICCDRCSRWQHTVCSGYFTNNDKRIPVDEYICFSCQYTGNREVLKFLENLCCWRRSLYVVFHEGLSTQISFSNRLGISRGVAKRIIDRLVAEGFVIKICKREPGTKNNSKVHGKYKKRKYEIVRNNAVKQQIKKYFNVDLYTFSRFLEIMDESTTTTRKRICIRSKDIHNLKSSKTYIEGDKRIEILPSVYPKIDVTNNKVECH